MSTTEDHRTGYTAGLRQIADFLDAHPEVPLPYLGASASGSALPCLPVYLVDGDHRDRDNLAVIARAMGTAVKAPKDFSDGSSVLQVWREFGGVVLMAQASREQVCTRVVTGTEDREVEEVVVPAVTLKVVKRVEVVEWQCAPLLAGEMDAEITRQQPAAPGITAAYSRLPMGRDDDAPVPSHDQVTACEHCGSDTTPLTEDRVCWNSDACGSRQDSLEEAARDAEFVDNQGRPYEPPGWARARAAEEPFSPGSVVKAASGAEYVIGEPIGLASGDGSPCDAAEFGHAPSTDGTGRCRCTVCARCHHHTGNAHQGHYWGYCQVTRNVREFHFCCPGDCELGIQDPEPLACGRCGATREHGVLATSTDGVTRCYNHALCAERAAARDAEAVQVTR